MDFLPTNLKDWSQTIQAIATVIALVVAACWFYVKGKTHSRANVKLTITPVNIENDKIYLRVSVSISNSGEIKLSNLAGISWVEQIKPCPDDIETSLKNGNDPVPYDSVEARWTELQSRSSSPGKQISNLEPGETDEMHFDFFIDKKVEVILVYTQIIEGKALKDKSADKAMPVDDTKGKKLFGWNATTVFDLKTELEKKGA